MKEECNVVISNGSLIGKEAVQNLLEQKEISGILLHTQYIEDSGRLGHASFYNFSAEDTTRPYISMMMCTSRLNREIKMEDAIKHVGEERLQKD